MAAPNHSRVRFGWFYRIRSHHVSQKRSVRTPRGAPSPALTIYDPLSLSNLGFCRQLAVHLSTPPSDDLSCREGLSVFALRQPPALLHDSRDDSRDDSRALPLRSSHLTNPATSALVNKSTPRKSVCMIATGLCAELCLARSNGSISRRRLPCNSTQSRVPRFLRSVGIIPAPRLRAPCRDWEPDDVTHDSFALQK